MHLDAAEACRDLGLPLLDKLRSSPVRADRPVASIVIEADNSEMGANLDRRAPARGRTKAHEVPSENRRLVGIDSPRGLEIRRHGSRRQPARRSVPRRSQPPLINGTSRPGGPMGWFRVVDGHLRYAGVTRAPFTAWTTTARGSATLAAARRQVRFGVFGRDRAARSRLWGEVRTILGDTRLQTIITEQARLYHSLLAGFAFVEALPRTTVDLRRLVVVPRALVNVRSHTMLAERLASLHLETATNGGDALRDFLVMTLVDEMDRAFVASRPTTRRPVPAADEWASVGVDVEFVWVKPCWEGPIWGGHHYLYEQPRGGLTWRERRRIDAAVRQIRAALSSCTRAERQEALQSAAASFRG